MEPGQPFSSSYAQARAKFLAAAASAGLAVQSYPHPLPGRDGEALATDLVLDGAANADRLLIVTSACHGVEGFCGSGVQVDALGDAALRAQSRANGVALLYVHALNPHGFSHLRRVTHENVDLNRNFQDFSQALPINEAYRGLHPLLLPDHWPPDAANVTDLTEYIGRHGMAGFQATTTRGQHEFADGLFYGGTAPTWSNQTVRQILREQAQSARRLAWVDVHTGLGPSGLGERIFACRDDAAALARARHWWGGNGATPVTSIYDGSSSSAWLTGLMWSAAYQECPQAEYTGLALEYGTLPVADMLQALRADHWLHQHPQAAPGLAAQIHQQMKDAFFTDTPLWREQILSQAREVLGQAVAGLGA